MTENQTVKERIKIFLKENGLTAYAFEKACGLSIGYIKNISKSIQPDKLARIGEIFPDLNPGWLMTGEGEMLRADRSQQPQQAADVEALRRRIAELEETVERQNRVIDALTGAGTDTCNIKRIG